MEIVLLILPFGLIVIFVVSLSLCSHDAGHLLQQQTVVSFSGRKLVFPQLCVQKG